MVEMELFQSLRPVAYGGAVGDEKAALAQNRAPAKKLQEMARRESKDGAEAWGALPEKERAAAGLEVQRAKEFAAELGQRMDLSKGVQSAATASQLGDFFQYIINQPVNLPRQKSALLPIVNKEIEGKRLSIYNPAVHAKFPMLGLLLKNTSGLHLMQGPITVFEGSVYAGDARIQDLQPNDERLISFAVDLGTEVEAKSHRPPERLTAIRIERGVVITTNRIREEKTYTATNRSGQERTLWIEHPYRAEFELVSKQEPIERTAEFRRFEMKLPAEAKKSVAMTIVEERDLNTSFSVSNSDDNQIRFFANNALASPELKKALEGALELKAKLAKIRQDLNNVNLELNNITQDQARLRQNLREMPSTAAAYKRYIEKFDKQETQIEELQAKQKDLQTQELKARQTLDSYLANLNVK